MSHQFTKKEIIETALEKLWDTTENYRIYENDVVKFAGEIFYENQRYAEDDVTMLIDYKFVDNLIENYITKLVEI